MTTVTSPSIVMWLVPPRPTPLQTLALVVPLAQLQIVMNWKILLQE